MHKNTDHVFLTHLIHHRQPYTGSTLFRKTNEEMETWALIKQVLVQHFHLLTSTRSFVDHVMLLLQLQVWFGLTAFHFYRIFAHLEQ